MPQTALRTHVSGSATHPVLPKVLLEVNQISLVQSLESSLKLNEAYQHGVHHNIEDDNIEKKR